MLIPDPTGSTWQRWAETLILGNPFIQNQIGLTLPWKEFAKRLALVVPNAPRPDFYNSWERWAVALRRALSS